jgi:hypothetical protein
VQKAGLKGVNSGCRPAEEVVGPLNANKGAAGSTDAPAGGEWLGLEPG